jgi:putative ABC transport system permease protein
MIQPWRHNRSLQLLLASLVIAVAAMTSVALFVERVDRGLIMQGSALMAADLVIQQGEPFAEEWLEQARQQGLETSLQASFPSVLFDDEMPQLVQVKAVDAAYPLRGRLEVRAADGELMDTAPKPGQMFVEARLAALMKLSIGDDLPLGQLRLGLQGTIEQEPDRGGSLFQLAPRLMMAYQDLDQTGLLGPASRVKYRLLLAGEQTLLQDYRDWAEQRLIKGGQILDVNNARPELKTALDRGHRFLNMAVLCATLLAGIAILLATRNYINRSMGEAAVLRTLGMTAGGILNYYLLQVAKVLLAGLLIGSLLGLAGQWLLSLLLGRLLVENLPMPGLSAFIPGLLYGSILLAGFALPALLRIRHVSPLRVLRRELTPPDVPVQLVWGMAIGSFLLLVFWQAGDNRLASALVLVLFAVLLVTLLAGRLLMVLLRPLSGRSGHLALGFAALARNPGLTRWQLAGFSLGISLLLILAIVRIDLVNTWLNSLSPTAPNHFLVNIQPDQQQSLQQWFDAEGIPSSGMYASSRARLVSIDGQTVSEEMFDSDRARHLATREYSLGFSDQLQSDNRIVAGDEWPPAQNAFSVEQDLAKKLGITVGSLLVFEIAGKPVSAPVSSLRSISWDSFNVNFFVQGNQSLMQQVPVAYLNSVYLSGNEAKVMTKLVDEYQGVSILDLRPILQQVRSIMDKGALAVEAVFGFTLFAAILVTMAAVLINRDEKLREIAVLRTLGASRRQILMSLSAEFGLLGLIAGLVAASLAALTGYLVALQLFGLAPVFNPWLWLAGTAAGVLILLGVGLLSTYSLLRTPPMAVLNRA